MLFLYDMYFSVHHHYVYCLDSFDVCLTALDGARLIAFTVASLASPSLELPMLEASPASS